MSCTIQEGELTGRSQDLSRGGGVSKAALDERRECVQSCDPSESTYIVSNTNTMLACIDLHEQNTLLLLTAGVHAPNH